MFSIAYFAYGSAFSSADWNGHFSTVPTKVVHPGVSDETLWIPGVHGCCARVYATAYLKPYTPTINHIHCAWYVDIASVDALKSSWGAVCVNKTISILCNKGSQFMCYALNLMCESLDCGRIPEHQEETHRGTKRTCKLHTETAQSAARLNLHAPVEICITEFIFSMPL